MAGLAVAWLGSGTVGCGLQTFRILAPLNGQLSRTGPIVASLALPPIAVPGSLRVRLDGADISASFSGNPLAVQASLDATAPGAHRIDAQVDIAIPLLGATFTLTASSAFETVALRGSDACELLNDAECLLPYPSSRFLVPDPTTPTGVRVQLPAEGMPAMRPAALDPAPFHQLDGFAPTTQVLVHFPGGVDPVLSGVARLLPAGCCGQAAGPPWIDTRTSDARSLDADSPTLIVDADSGERVLHFAELDVRAAGNPARQAFVLRPLRSLVPGHRYLVAIRGLVHPDGSAITPEPVFTALRDARPSDIPQINARRAAMDDVFTRLEDFGVQRTGLQLAFDFTVQSDWQLTHQMLSMRDQAFAWLASVESDLAQTPFTVTDVRDVSQCSAPGDAVWREVAGTFRSPLFLPEPPLQDISAPAHELVVDAHDEPVQNGFMDAPFTISIPCASLDPARATHPIVLGHGAFGTGDGMVRDIPQRVAALAAAHGLREWDYVAGATDWGFLCCAPGGILWIAFNVIGVLQSQLDHFAAIPDRTKQGELNTLVLARMMKRGLFNRHAAFRIDDGQGTTRGVFPGERDPANEMFYLGISLGGINGTFFAALTPDVERFQLDVPAINFSQLLQRSALFASPIAAGFSFETLIAALGLVDPMQILVSYGLINEIWASGEPGGWATHVTKDPLPGSGVGPRGDAGKRVLLTMAWHDKTVPNLGSEVAARTLGLAQLDGSVLRAMPQLPDAAGPLDSAFVVYDSGEFDIFDPAHQIHLPPLANAPAATPNCDPHGRRFRVPAGIAQTLSFLRPGGRVENTCLDDGLCNASQPFEIPDGDTVPCQP